MLLTTQNRKSLAKIDDLPSEDKDATISRSRSRSPETESLAADSVHSDHGPSTGSSLVGLDNKNVSVLSSDLSVSSNKSPLTQLSVPPEEDSAFKTYINTFSDLSDHSSCNNPTDNTNKEQKSYRGHDSHQETESNQDAISRSAICRNTNNPLTELRLLVRRREAGALIGKKGSNIERLRESFRSSVFSIPDTGNGPERVVCITTDEESMDLILADITKLLLEKSPENDEQVELKLLIHSSHAGSIIGIGGQTIKKLRNESRAAIKIYEMCCPSSNERVCAIKAKPPTVASTIRLIKSILKENPIKGTIKPYDALNFDLNIVDKYGGYLPEDGLELLNNHYSLAFRGQHHQIHGPCQQKHFPSWRSSGNEYCDSCEIHDNHEAKLMVDNFRLQADAPILKYSTNQQGAIKRTQPGEAIEQRQRPLRFHPYAQNQGQFNVGLCRASTPLRHPSPAHYHPSFALANNHCSSSFNPANLGYHRSCAVRASHHPHPHSHSHSQSIAMSPTETCRHMRPCLCMFLPMIPNDLPSDIATQSYTQVRGNKDDESTSAQSRNNQRLHQQQQQSNIVDK